MISGPQLPAPNPWRGMWFSPRRTIRGILEAETKPSWITIILLAAAHNSLLSVQLDPGADTVSISRSMFPTIVAVLQFVFGILVGPFLLAIVGGWLGGEADPTEIRHAVVWSNVPFAVATAAWVPV